MANFADEQCINGNQLTHFPSGFQEVISLGDTTNTVKLPHGFIAVSFRVTETAYPIRNFTLSIFVASASF